MLHDSLIAGTPASPTGLTKKFAKNQVNLSAKMRWNTI
jgi:hypothetical protein